MAYNEIVVSTTLAADSSLAGYTGVSGTAGAADPHYGKAMYRFVKLVGARACGRAAAASDRPTIVGVCQNKPQVVGQAATVAVSGISNVLTGGVYAAGVELTVDSTGRAIAATASANVVALSIEASTAANTVSSALLRLGN